MTPSVPDSPRSSLNIEQLVAFNDELEALVRAGIPLERGLDGAAGEYQGRLGHALRDLGQRLDAGEPLAAAIAQSGSSLPAVYQAIIEAGLRSGRLADALQGMARIGRGVIEARRTIVLACFYPGLVLVLAYALFLFFLVVIFPRFQMADATFDLRDPWVVRVLELAGPSVGFWGPIVPLGLLALVVGWGWLGRSRSLDGNHAAETILARFPGVGGILANYRAANFTDLLAHLVEHEVPLDQAVRLAGNTVGDGTFRRSAARFGAELATGASPATASQARAGGFPPLIAWMIGSGHRQGDLAAGLRHLATSYRRKADRRARAFRVFLPGFLILVIGSVAVLAYGILLFVPLRSLWDGLAVPLN